MLQFLDPQPALRELQIEAFQPVCQLLRDSFGLVYVFEDSLATAANEENIAVIQSLAEEMDPRTLLVLDTMANPLKSLGLALLVCAEKFSAEEALRLSRLEESFQAARFGLIEEFHGLSAAEVLTKLHALRVYGAALGVGGLPLAPRPVQS